MSKYSLYSILIIFTFLSSSLVYSQTDDRALARAQTMLRQLNSEKEGLQAQLASLQQEFDKYKKNVAGKLEKAEVRESKISSSLENWQQGYDKLNKEYQAKSRELAYEKRRASLLTNSLDTQTKNFEMCKNNNSELAAISQQLLDRYDDKGFVDLLKEKEFITGIKHVALENFVQDQRYRILDFSLEDSHFLIEPVTQPAQDERMQPNAMESNAIEDEGNANVGQGNQLIDEK